MPSYDKTYLLDAMENLGEATDCATNVIGLDIGTFWNAFIATGYAGAFQAGSPRVVAGLSGTEVALRVSEESGIFATGCGSIQSRLIAERNHEYQLSSEYWCGWIMAYYQWHSCRTFKDISRALPISDVLRMYPTFHEESEDRFVEAANELFLQQKSQSNLQRQRQIMGYSQSQLAKISGVGLRAIQQYEQGVKDINNAAASKVAALARVLHCSIEDLLEPRESYEYALVSF